LGLEAGLGEGCNFHKYISVLRNPRLVRNVVQAKGTSSAGLKSIVYPLSADV
jgi:hypothetical protein